MRHVIGQNRSIKALKNAIRQNRLHPGLLFVGPDGVGRETTALWLAGTLLCDAPVDQEGCGQCSPCKRVASGNHPDLHLILSDSERVNRGLDQASGSKTVSRVVQVDTIRGLNQRLRMGPYEGKAAVAIVPDAQKMQPSASNAFLKMLEEPPPNTYLILLAPHSRAVLETIASRCLRLSFSPLTPDHIDAIRIQLADGDARGRPHPTGQPGHSTTHEDGAGTAQFGEEVQSALNILSAPGTARFLDLIESLGKDRENASLFIQELLNEVGVHLRQSVSTSSDSHSSVRPGLHRGDMCRILEQGMLSLDALRQNAQVQATLEEFFVRGAAQP
jgi:DNA polymerase III subunit delta'